MSMAAVIIGWIVLVGSGIHSRPEFKSTGLTNHSQDIPRILCTENCERFKQLGSGNIFQKPGFCAAVPFGHIDHIALNEWENEWGVSGHVFFVCQHMTSQHSEPSLASNK